MWSASAYTSHTGDVAHRDLEVSVPGSYTRLKMCIQHIFYTARALSGSSPNRDTIKKPCTNVQDFSLAGETGLEPAADGFGDRYSTNCATPLRRILVYNTVCSLVNEKLIFRPRILRMRMSIAIFHFSTVLFPGFLIILLLYLKKGIIKSRILSNIFKQ